MVGSTSSDRLERVRREPLRRKKKSPAAGPKKRRRAEPPPPPRRSFFTGWVKGVVVFVLIALAWAIGYGVEQDRLERARSEFLARAKAEVRRVHADKDPAELDAIVEQYHRLALEVSFHRTRHWSYYEWDAYIRQMLQRVDDELFYRRR